MKSTISTLFAISFAIQVGGQCLPSEQAYKDYFKKNIKTLDQIEGIWTGSSVGKIYDQYNRLVHSQNYSQEGLTAVISDGIQFKICSISEATDGSINIFKKTTSSGTYLYHTTYPSSKAVGTANATLKSDGILEFTLVVPDKEVKYKFGDKYNGYSVQGEYTMIKLYPLAEDISKYSPGSGTGFAISSTGIIVTNQHVVDGATTIYVRGINGDFSKRFKSKIEVIDKNNDLAIIRIDDFGFSSLGSIPYVIQGKSSEVGTSVFCLGYPLRATMGDEVKLTNGIISSKSGFQGDISAYQISAPIQPGNSGGPLFDDKGNLVGIINAYHSGAENVSYAVKTSYLMSLIDNLPSVPNLQSSSTLNSKTLPEQVKIIRNFTYIIETE